MLDSDSNYRDDCGVGGCDGVDRDGVIYNDGYYNYSSGSDYVI